MQAEGDAQCVGKTSKFCAASPSLFYRSEASLGWRGGSPAVVGCVEGSAPLRRIIGPV
jgi:hypothetical protein